MEKEKDNIGRRIKLIVRTPNGVNSIWTGYLLREDIASFTIKTERGEERTEPKMWCAVEWLSPAKEVV